jgi:hypothetical protein
MVLVGFNTVLEFFNKVLLGFNKVVSMVVEAAYTWVFNTWFLGRSEIVDFWILSGPGGPPKTIPDGGELRPHLPEEF